jgi:hypothetical protein
MSILYIYTGSYPFKKGEVMPIHERRQHFRIDDCIYFDYRIIAPGEFFSDLAITNQLLGEQGKKFMDAVEYFKDIDSQLSELTQEIGLEQPSLAHYFNLLNSKIDYLSRQVLMVGNLEARKVNISLGGMSFKTKESIKEQTNLKIVIYVKPKMTPIIIDGRVVYSQYQNTGNYRTSIQFNSLTHEQEQLLSEHILLAQIKNRSN